MKQAQIQAGLGRQELLDSLKESKILSAEELEHAESLCPGADGTTLAQALVEQGTLTPFQLDAVLNKRYEKLHIGNYVILDKIGAGGMGAVYKARHRRMKRVVALKVLTRNLCKDKTFVQRFQREVEAIAQLSHPNIVMAFDADEARAGHFLVMEYVNGQDLSGVVQKQGPLPVAEAVQCILQAARGLDYVHRQRMIHRDIKPANLLRDASGTVKLLDLGLTRLTGPAGAAANGLTQAGGILGTVDYMSPEQAMDPAATDQRGDIYSLGATLYFLLTGHAPYVGQTPMDTLIKHRELPIPALTADRPDVPAALEEVFRRMMAKTPEARYQSMAEVVRDLEALGLSAAGATAAPAAAAGKADGNRPSTVPPPAGKTSADTPPAAYSDEPPLFDRSRLPTLKLLLVEPSRTQSAIIQKYLQENDVRQVVAVQSAAEALRAVAADLPDVVVSALHLADMSGVLLAQQVRADRDPAPGFVLISSEAQGAETKQFTMCAQSILLRKPFSPKELVEALCLVAGRTRLA